VSRIPLRLRLTLPFAFAMGAVLAAMGFFIYDRVANALLVSVDQNLTTQSAELVSHGDRTADRDRADAPQIIQFVSSDGAVVRSSPQQLARILGPTQVRTVLMGRRLWLSRTLPPVKGTWRLLALPSKAGGTAAVVVLGRSLEPRDEALDRLLREFLVGGPVALLVATLAGYALAAAALRPVEAMRRRAAAITASTAGQRLPVPPARDELGRLAMTLNDMLARLEAALEHERRFVDDASHELRTPLALLKTELEIALRHPRSREELEQALRSAADDTDELVRLAEELLLVARSDQGELPIRTERLSVAELLEEVAERFRSDAAERDRSIAVTASPDEEVEADPVRLKQALGNLVRNALVHGAGPIALEAQGTRADIELHVLDSGPGFADDFRWRGFERFSRADASRSGGGAGLGLAIVDVIARRHGGRAEVRNRADGGADAFVIVPKAAERGPGRFRPRSTVRQS
jgi:two-component system OmpR family sensor kinase